MLKCPFRPCTNPGPVLDLSLKDKHLPPLYIKYPDTLDDAKAELPPSAHVKRRRESRWSAKEQSVPTIDLPSSWMSFGPPSRMTPYRRAVELTF
jgi:hypothetical protein